MILMSNLFNKLTIVAISVGLGSALVHTLSTIQLTEADKQALRNMESSQQVVPLTPRLVFGVLICKNAIASLEIECALILPLSPRPVEFLRNRSTRPFLAGFPGKKEPIESCKNHKTTD